MKKEAYLQYKMLIIPAKISGTMEKVPLRASTLSIMNIAIIDVNATVIYITTFQLSFSLCYKPNWDSTKHAMSCNSIFK